MRGNCVIRGSVALNGGKQRKWPSADKLPKMSYSNMEMEMSEYIYANEPAEPQQMEETALNTPGEDDRAEEREVVIYEGSDYYEGHRAATPSAVKPGE